MKTPEEMLLQVQEYSYAARPGSAMGESNRILLEIAGSDPVLSESEAKAMLDGIKQEQGAREVAAVWVAKFLGLHDEKTREEIIEQAMQFASDSPASVEGEIYRLLIEIAGKDETSMMDKEAREDLLHSMDIYHGQTQAVRFVRRFLN